MATPEVEGQWPPADLAEYYNSTQFLAKMGVLKRRLERDYPDADAETIVYDVVADSLVKEIENKDLYVNTMGKFSTERKYLNYLYKSCRRKVIDKARSFQGKFRQLLDDDSVEYGGLGPGEIAIEEEARIDQENLVKGVRRIMRSMSSIDRLILTKRLEGATYTEIAEHLRMSVSGVHNRFATIKRIIAIRFTQDEPDS